MAEMNQKTDMHDVSVCIVVPTYNESGNIKKLLDTIYDDKNSSKYIEEHISMNVLVVDDNSPDGTADVVKAYHNDNSQVYIFERKQKNGLGAAYIAGINHAIELLNPDIIFEMDADLSHDPKYILPMIREIRSGADFVIGSRYVAGGSIPDNWGFKRVMISKAANVYAKTLLRIRNVHDCTGGFRAMRTSAIAGIDLTKLKTKGYAFQISLLQQIRTNNLIIREVPIHFKDRENGESKMRLSDMLGVGLFVFTSSITNIFSSAKTVRKTGVQNFAISQTYSSKDIRNIADIRNVGDQRIALPNDVSDMSPVSRHTGLASANTFSTDPMEKNFIDNITEQNENEIAAHT